MEFLEIKVDGPCFYFFIMHADYPLPYQYTIFGKVTDGFDVIDSIANVETDTSD